MRLRRCSGLVAVVALSCGGASVTEAPPAPVAPPQRALPRPHVSGELGEIDEAATTKAFEWLRPSLMRCYTNALERIDYLAGDVKFYVRVQADGHLRWAFFEESTLGDHATEQCMLGVLKAAEWPVPQDGEAEVHQTLGFDAPPDVRPPTAWQAGHVAAAIAAARDAASSCKKHGDGLFKVTMYIAPGEGGGQLVSAGAAPPNASAAADLDCLMGVVGAMKLPSPGPHPAKVTFSL